MLCVPKEKELVPVHVWKAIKEILTKAAVPSVCSAQIVQLINHVLEISVQTHAQEFVVLMQNVTSSIMYQAARVLKDTLEIHLPNALKMNL